MERKEFGKLVAALRQEMGWTQFDLAQHIHQEAAVVSQIERGIKRNLDAPLLVRLADLFHLSTLERRSFFLASTGIVDSQITRPPSAGAGADAGPEAVLDRLVKVIGSLPVPACLLDDYMDVVALNYIAFAFFQMPLEMMAEARNKPAGMNVIRMVFGRDLMARTHVQTNWEQVATSAMRSFREASLCRRADPHYQYLLRAFRDPEEYPLFDRFWRIASSMEADRDSALERFEFDHINFGHLNYTAVKTLCMTSEGELHINQFIPTDAPTKAVFDRLAERNGAGVIRGAPWPVKSMP